jgi:hypothetical protein
MCKFIELKTLLPAIITGFVAIVGFIIQIVISIYIQKQNRRAEKLKSFNSFIIPLQKHLMGLMSQYEFSFLSVDVFIKWILGLETNINISSTFKENTLNIYNEMSKLLIKGKYSYIDRTTHNNIIRIQNHVYCVESILYSSGMSNDIILTAIENNRLPDLNKFIKHISKLYKKL